MNYVIGFLVALVIIYFYLKHLIKEDDTLDKAYDDLLDETEAWDQDFNVSI